ncbi:methyltransferase domain-containing protein [Oceanibium sediminis]|uniref:methyltransferase domain-containing protein n=1 Tax=Oceanibium sediminis TaxID=2026339 RepID=UPI000DD472BE|nr:methyltransferase domain-containing protein [Oceanibium sediminis]
MPPKLTDRTALALHRARAARGPELFLHRLAVDELSERLSEVNRSFTAPAIVGPWGAEWRDWLVADGVIAGAEVVADADPLQLTPGAHDLVIHALSLHWADDPVGQLVQMRRALAPDGLGIAVLFAGRSLQELRASLAEAETALRGGLSPRVVPMADLRDLGGLLQRAGFALPVADSLVQTLTYADLFALVRDLRGMGEGNALAARERAMPPRGLFAAAAAQYAASFPAEDGRIKATAEIVFLTGWAPSDSQQQPLRPGSAKMRLADALGAEERRAGDPVAPPRRKP